MVAAAAWIGALADLVLALPRTPDRGVANGSAADSRVWLYSGVVALAGGGLVLSFAISTLRKRCTVQRTE